jgi:hypothetical protein
MNEHEPLQSGAEGHEKRDINVRKVAVYGVGVLLALGVISLVVTLIVFKDVAREDANFTQSPVYDSRQLPPEPRLQAHPTLDLKNLREYEESRLTSYGWVDRPNGVVRLPIDRAMELVLEKGLPVRKDARIEVPGAPAATKETKGVKR